MISTQITILSDDSTVSTALAEWIIENCTRDTRILDIGAGCDISKVDATIQPHVARLIGIDPSKNILINPSVHEGYNISLEDFAQQYQEKFDIIFCTMVLEHVNDPDAFFAACKKVLQPGGMFFAVTPNLWHYFGMTTKVTSMLHINEWLLDRLIGKQTKESYHFPTTYKVNSIRAIKRKLAKTGFEHVEFRYFDNPQEVDYVIPAAFRWCSRLYSRLLYQFKLSRLMGRMMFRATLEFKEGEPRSFGLNPVHALCNDKSDKM